MTVDELLTLFDAAAGAQRDAIASIDGSDRRARTDRPGQYLLDVVADAAVVDVLAGAGVRIVSEESGESGPVHAPVTVVVDPVDGSTNCAREIPYWGISLCAVDAAGPLCALVTNGATGTRFTAVRDGGAFVDGVPARGKPTREIGRAVVAISGFPARPLAWRQFRALGSAALALCDVAAGRIDAYVDAALDQHRPWDYLGGALVCAEAGALVVDVHDRPLAVTDPAARRQLLAAATPELLDAVRSALTAP